MIFTRIRLFSVFYCLIIVINGIQTDFSMLNINQTQIWLNAISEINNTTENLHIEIAQLNHQIDIPLYDDLSPENRHLFKQNINKRIDCLLYENELNSSISSNIYNPCSGGLSSRNVLQTVAGTYVYTANQSSHSLGLILVEITDRLYWLNGSKTFFFDPQSSIKNGTVLTLVFETMIYYNSNSDLINLNNKINAIIQQANISITMNNQTNLENFISMEDLSCQRHEQIVYDDLRLLIITCTTTVTFKCPLKIGSTCWIENKQLSNIQLHMNSNTFISNQTLTLQIDV